MRPTTKNCMWICTGFLIALGIAGCKNGPTVDIGTVHGTVRINGRPQRAIAVSFSPDREKGNGVPVFANGNSDDQGNYALKYSLKDKIGDGAAVGWHRVTLLD